MKISDHHVRSPLLNIKNACQTCHKVPESELLARAERIQEKTYAMREVTMDAVMTLIDSIKDAQAAGADETALTTARSAQRRATFLLDFVEAEHSTGFLADQEAARVLFMALDPLRQGQMALAGQQTAAEASAPTASAASAVPDPSPVAPQRPAVPAAGPAPEAAPPNRPEHTLPKQRPWSVR